MTVRFGGTDASHKIFVNGVDKTITGSVSTDPTTAVEAGTITIGNEIAGRGFSAPGTYKFARMLWFNRELTIAEQRTIEAYLRNKYTPF